MKVRSKAKRFFAILLSLAMVVSMMPGMAFASAGDPANVAGATLGDGTTVNVNVMNYAGDYDGSAHGVTVTENLLPAGYEVKYSDAEDGTYSTEAITLTDAGEKTVWVAVFDNADTKIDSVSAKVTVNQKNATITPNDFQVTVGDAAPVYDAVVTGTVGGEELEYTLDCIYTDQSPKGEYEITVALGTGAVNDNYNITAEKGTLSVLPVAAEVKAVAGLEISAGADADDTDYSGSIIDGSATYTYSLRYEGLTDSGLTAEQQTAYAALKDALGLGEKAGLVDIEFYLNDGTVPEIPLSNVELSAPVELTIDYPGAKAGNEYKIYHWNGADFELISTTTCGVADELKFESDSFSPFVIIGTSKFWQLNFSNDSEYYFVYTNGGLAEEDADYEFELVYDTALYENPVVYVDGVAHNSAIPGFTFDPATNKGTIPAVAGPHDIWAKVSKVEKTLTYDANVDTVAGEMLTAGSVPAAATYAIYEEFIVENGAGLVKKDSSDVVYSFAGWNTAADGTGIPYTAGNSYQMGDSDLTLYAVWEKAPEEYTITYYENISDTTTTFGTAQVKEEGQSINLSSDQPTRAGYTFTGWATSPAGSVAYTPGAVYVNDANLDLYAVWSADQKTITYYNNYTGASPEVFNSYTINEDAEHFVISEEPTRAGYTFAGWATAADAAAADPAYAAGASYTAADDLNLYAVWSAVTHTITYNANTSEPVTDMPAVNPATYAEGAAINLDSSIPERVDYTFAGWSTENDATVATYQPGDMYVVTNADITLYAVWVADQYSVTYYNNYEGASPDVFKYVTEKKINEHVIIADEPSRDGYTFKGWAITPKGTVEYTNGGGNYTAAADLNLYAVWEVATYDITYYKNDGTTDQLAGSPQVKTHGIDLNLLSTQPERTGYTFQGWATAADGAVAYAPGDVYVGNAVMDLYAVWEANVYNITYVLDGGTIAAGKEVPTYTYGVGAVLPTTPDVAKDGFVFAGWTALDADIDAGTNPVISTIGTEELGDKTFYAHWDANVELSVDSSKLASGKSAAADVKVGSASPVTYAAPIVIATGDAVTVTMTGSNALGTETTLSDVEVYKETAPGVFVIYDEATVTSSGGTFTIQFAMPETNVKLVPYAKDTPDISIDVTETAANEGAALTEYEGESVKLTAKVTYGGANIDTGYMYFYKNGVLINEYPVEVHDGAAELTAVMSGYDTSKVLADNKDVFTAKYAENDLYEEKVTDPGKDVLIRSTVIDVPVIQSLHSTTVTATTELAAIEGLPAATPIEFSLVDPVKAMDGRTLAAGTDFTLQWEDNSNAGMFVEVGGATATPYSIASGDNGDSFRLTLKPIGHMVVGSTSLTATIGTLADPEVTINVTTPYPAGNGSHYGDKVTLSVGVVGTSALPTGAVSFWYIDASNVHHQIGEYTALTQDVMNAKKAVAKVSTTELPQGEIDIYVKYHGDTAFRAEDVHETSVEANAIKDDYKVWSVLIEQTDLVISAWSGSTEVTVLDAASTYTLKLKDEIHTTDGQLMKDAEYDIVWQQSSNGVDWEKVPGATDSHEVTVSPENETMQYRAQVTTTTDLFAPPLATVPTRLDTKWSNIIGSDEQAVTVLVTTDKTSEPAPYTNAVYEGNNITIYANITPTDAAYTEDVTGKVQFFYTVGGGAETPIPSVDPLNIGSNESTVVEKDGKYYAAITTNVLPANAEDKQQIVNVVAKYMGTPTYKAAENNLDVTVYSSTVFALDTVQNEVIAAPSESTAGIIIYAPEDVLVSDGSPTVLTLKNLYTLDAQDGTNEAIVTTPGEYTSLTENINYTIKWQYTTALDTVNPENSSWVELSAAGHQATVEPLAGYAYRAVITVDQAAERTVMSQKTYYSNILAADNADAVLQLRPTPASSGGFKDTDLIFDAYVSGGTTVPVGDITLVLSGTLGGGVERTATAVNGHVKFGGGIGDTAGPINLPADVYTMKASYEGNNGYKTELNQQTYIVRYKAEEVAVDITESAYERLIYDGTIQRPDEAAVTFNGGSGHTAAQAKANASVVFNYEMKDGDDWVAVDAPFDAGEYRVTAVLPESIYYEAQQSAPYTFEIAQKEISIDDIIVQAKVYDGSNDVNVLDVELAGVVAGDSVYTTGGAATAAADALKANEVTYTATGLTGPDAANYKFAAGGDCKTEDFIIARNLVTVDSSAIIDKALAELKVYDNYGTEMIKGTDYTARFFFHDGSGVKETTNLNADGKYTVIIAPKDTANYKGGESFVMNIASGAASFKGNDAAASAVPGIISITGTQQLWNANSVTAEASNGSTVSVSYNVTVDKAGRYGVTATAAGCDETHGILTVYKAEATHIVPVVNDKVFDGEAVTVENATAFTTPGTYFTYTGGEIIGISYDAPKDAGVYTVTAHVPATDTTVAYMETSTFEITQKPITVSAVSVTKETYRTNPALRVTYDGLVSGDSDIKDMLVLPSFNLLNTEGVNHDLNQVGDFTIVPYGIVSRNYEVVTYNNANFAVQHTDPALAMNIVGLPNGQVYYGDEFQVSLYGTVGERADGNGTYNNPSSVINYFVSDGSGWSKDNGNVTIDNDGNVKIKGAAAADFTIKAERGTGDYKIVKKVNVNVKNRPVYISMIGEDSKVYAGADQSVDVSKYVVSGSLVPITLTLVNFAPNAGRDVDEYLITASYSDDKYVGKGKGLMSITPAPAVVTSKNNLNNTYGQTPDVLDTDYEVSGNVGADSPADVITTVVTKSDVRFNSDVDNYEIFSAGVENKNYDVSYESGKYEVVEKALTKVAAGVDDTAVINTITTQVKRAYGVANPQMGYQVNGLIDGDSLADLLIDKNFVVYSRVQEDDANVVGSASNEHVKALNTEYVNGYAINDNYGLIDLHDSIANINSEALNYTMTPDDGLLDIYQYGVKIDVQDLTVKAETPLSDSSYYAVVYRVLTEAPMNDTIADLKLKYEPTGTAGTAPCTNGASISALLTPGSTDISVADYFAQNYYRLSTSTNGTLYVKAQAAKADITADKDSVTVKTTDADNNPVDVGNISYIVLDKNGKKVVDGVMLKADNPNTGEYSDDPYDTFYKEVDGTGYVADATISALPSGTYTILLNPDGVYALEPTTKNFTVGGTVPSGGGGGGGGSVEPPLLIKDDHFAYMRGDDYGYFRPDAKLTRAEAATIFYNLLTDKSMGDMATSFTDVKSGEWYAKAINTLASRGILGGYEDGTFKPSANITRAEFAAIASRFDDLSSGTASFKDVPSTHWAYSYIVSAATKGWITGYEDGTFKPEANITRAEVVTLVNRVLERVPDKNFIDKNIDDIKVLKDVNKDHWAYYYMIEATNGHDYSKDSKGNETWSKLQ